MSEKIARTQFVNIINKAIAPGSLYHKRPGFCFVKTIKTRPDNAPNYKFGILKHNGGF
jgi:hypothetical protein